MNCSIPSLNKETLSLVSNLGEKYVLDYFRRKNLFSLPSLNELLKNNSIAFSEAKLKEIVSEFLPKNVFQVKHLDEIIANLPPATQAAFFKDVLYFGDNVTKEQIAEETFHAIFQRVIPPSMKQKYLKEGMSLINNINKEKEAYLKAYPKALLLNETELEERIIEEAIAKRYVEYFNRNIIPSNKKGILKLLENLFKWLKNLFNKLNNNTNLEVFFDNIIKGNFSKSSVNDSNDSNVPTLRLIEYEYISEANNVLKRNLTVKESEFIISSIASIVIELNQKLTKEQAVNLKLTNRGNRIRFAIDKLRQHYEDKGDNPRFVSALSQHQEEKYNPDEQDYEKMFTLINLPNLKYLSEDVNNYLNIVTGSSLKNEEIEESENDVASLDFSDNISANEKGFEGISAWLRSYIATTGKYIGKFEIEGKDISILSPIDKNKVYYSLARSMQNTTHELERLYKLVTIASFSSNKETRLLLDRVISDVIDTNEQDVNKRFESFKENITKLYSDWKSNKKENHYIINNIKGLKKDNVFILQTILQGFDLWKRDNNKIVIDIKSKSVDTKVFDANQNSATKAQMSMWKERWTEIMLNPESKEEIRNKLLKLKSDFDNERFTEDTVYDAIKLIFGNVEKTYIDYLLDSSTEKSIGGTFKPTASLEDVKIIFEKALFDTRSVIKTPLMFDNTEGAVSRIEKLAVNTSKINEDVIESTYKDAENKTRYSYQNKTFQLYMFNEIFSEGGFEEYLDRIKKGELYEYGDGKFLQQASSFLYQTDNPELNHIVFDEQSRWKSVFLKGSYYSVDGLDVNNTGASTFGKMTSRDFLLWKLHLKSFRTKSNEKDEENKVINYTQPIHINLMEAKRTSSFKEVLVIDDLFKKGVVTDKAIDLFEKEILKEVRRMFSEKPKIINWLEVLTKDKEDGKYKIKLTRKNVLENSDIDTAEGIIEKYHTGTYVIKKENGKITILEADARALQFTDNVKSLLSKKSFNNIITEVFNKENINEIDRNYKKEIVSQLNEYILEFKELVKSLKGLLPSSSRYNNLNIALPNDEFINDELSSWLNTIWVNQLLNSDSALLVKNDGADFVKRAGGQNAAIFSVATTFYSDLIPGIKNFDKINYVVGNDTEGVISFKPLTDDGKNNTVDSSDAQSYMTVEAYIKYLYSMSKLTKQASEILFKIKDGKVLTDEDIEYLKDNNMYFNVIKPVGYDGYFYFKTGTVMLTKDLTSYYDNVEKKWKAKPGKESLHNLREKMENSGVDYYLPQTASKQLTINKYTEEFDNLKYKEKEKDEIWNSSINVMSTNFFGQQMENPAGKESIIDGSQMLEIILNEQNENVTVSLNGTKFSIGEMMKEWRRLSINRVEFSFQQALNEIADKNLILQYNKFLDKVKETLINSGADDQLLEIFSLDENGQPKYNLNMSLSIDKFINLLMSHFSKGVLQQKVAGDAMALVSSHGFNSIKKVVKYKDEEGNDIYSWKYIRESDPEYKIALEKHKKSPLTNLTNVAEYDEFNGKNDSELTLKLKEIYKENEDVYFIDQLRFGKPVYAFNNEGIVTGVEYYGAESLIPNPKYKKNLPFKKLFAMFGIRIPSQDKHSAINLIWVDNIPSYYGNTIMCSKEIQYLSGSDYDIDKLYIHRKETFEKDGEEVVWSEEHDTFEMYKFYHTTKNKFIKNQINKLLETNEEYQDILKAIEVIKENYKEELENVDEYFNKTNQLIDKIISLLERKKKEKKESRKEGRDKVYNDNKEKINEEIRKEIIYLKQQARENVIVKSILEESNISELTQDDLTKLNKESQEDFENELKNLKKKFVNEKISNIIENEDEYSDLAKNLKTQETYLKGIITRLKNVKSEKFEFIKILTDLKELHERRKHIKSVVAHVVFLKNKLITSEEVFEKLKKEKGILIIPIINNKMLDLKIRFLMNEHTLNRTEDEAIALTPATQTNLKELIRQAYIIKDNKPYYLFKKVTKEKTSEGVEKEVYVDEFTTDVKHSTHSTLGQSTAHKNIVTGKKNIGVAVVGNLLHLFSKKADINLRSFITIEDITPYGKDGLHVLTETTLSNFNISKNVKLQRIADIISELISAATDEVKDQQNAKYGLTIEALNIVVPILMLGGSLDFAIRLVNTKGVREYLNKVDLKDNIAKTEDETEELSYSNEMILNNLFNSYKEKGYKTTPLSIVDLKEGKFEANALELAAKMLQISKEVGLAKYVIGLKKGLGKTLEEFEDGEEKINSTTKETLSDNHITTSALVFSKKNLNESLGIYKHQIKLHEYISELLNKNIISRREKFRKFKYLFLNNFKPATYDEAKNWMNDKMISFFYSRLYFSFLEKRNDFSENDFRNFTNKPLEEIEKEWKDFVSDVISGKANIKEELMKEIKQNPLLIKLKTNNQGRIYAPTFIKGDIATNISLLESYEDLHTKLSNTPYKDLMWKLFHYSIRKDGWTFKGGSLSKVIPPVFYTDHSKSLDMFLFEEDGLVENSLFGGKYTPEYLTFLAIERSVKEKEGLKYVRKTNSKQDGIWKNIYKNKTIKLSDLASLSEDKLTWLVDKGYIVISPERKIYPQFPLYHYFSEINTDTNKPENVLHKIKNVKAKFKDGNIREVTVPQYAYYYGEIQQVLETTYEAVVVEEKPNVISLPVKKNIVIEKLDEIKEIEQEQQSSVKGINIKKDKTQYNSLANRLTNPSEYSTLEYNVESIYKKNSSKFDVNTKQRILNNKVVSEEQALKHDMNLMYKLQVEKFEKHPELIDEINAKGGLEFIKNSSHIIGVPNSRWEGEGMNSNFIKVLAKSYEKVAKELGKFLENPNVPVTSKESNINSNNQNFNFSNNEPVLVGDKNNVENTVEVKTVQEENKINQLSNSEEIYNQLGNISENVVIDEVNGKKPVVENQNYYEGNIKPEPNTIFVFGSNPEGRHGAGAAKIAKEQFGAIYGQGEGLQGNAYALPTKDLRVKENNGFKSISFEQIVKNIQKLYEVARQNPNKQFKIGYRNTIDKSLNGYTGLEMIEMFNQAGEIPFNIVFSKEWIDTGKITQSSKPIVAYRTETNQPNVETTKEEKIDIVNKLKQFTKKHNLSFNWSDFQTNIFTPLEILNKFFEKGMEFAKNEEEEKQIFPKYFGLDGEGLSVTIEKENENKWYFSSLYLPEFMQNKGMGKDIVDMVKYIASESDKTIYLWSEEQAVGFWEKQGFKKTGEKITESDKHFYDKNLPPFEVMEIKIKGNQRGSETNKEENLENISKNISTPALNFGFKNQKTKIIPQGSNPSNDVIFEDDDFVYLMNDQQQIAFNNIKNKIDEIFTKYSYLKSDEKATFNNSYLDAVYKGKVLKEMYDNMYGLQGSGGTGKSSLSKAIKKYITNKYPHKTLVFSAPTHKAATVLQESLGYDSEKVDEGNVFTNASLVGSTKENSDVFELSPDGNYFRRNKPKFGADIDVIIFDESSMIDVSFIEALQKRLMSKVVGNNKKIPFMLFLGDMKQLPPINQSSGFNRGFITMAILNGNKSSKLTQIMRTSDEFFNQIYNSIGNQIEKNIQKRLETPVNETFTPNPYDYTEFLRLIEKPQGNLFVYNTEEAILKDYANELFKTNNPRKAYYSHYNRIDNPYTMTVLKKIRDNFMEMIFGTTSHLNHSIPFSQVDDYLDKFGGKNILNEKGISSIKESELTNIPQFIEIENIRNFIFGDYVQSPDNFPLASSTFTIHSEDINPYALSVMRSINKQDKGFNLKLNGEVFFDGKGSFKPTSRYRVLDIIQKRYNSKSYFDNIINDFSLSTQFGNSKLAKNINDKRNNPEDVKIDGIYINPEMNLILETILLYTRQDRVRAYSYFMNTYTTYTYEDDGKDEMMNTINARNIFIMRQANTDKIIIKLAIPYKITFQEESGVSYLLNQLGSNQKEFKTSKDRFYSQNVFQKSYLGSSHTTQGDGFEKIYGGISNVLGQQNVKEDAKASSVYTILTRSMKEIAVLNTSSNYSKFSPNDLQSFDELSNDNAPNCNFI